MRIRIRILTKVMRICDHRSRILDSILSRHGPRWLHFWALKLVHFDCGANQDPAPAFHSNAEPDPRILVGPPVGLFIHLGWPIWGCRAGNRTQDHLTAARPVFSGPSLSLFCNYPEGPGRQQDADGMPLCHRRLYGHHYHAAQQQDGPDGLWPP